MHKLFYQKILHLKHKDAKNNFFLRLCAFAVKKNIILIVILLFSSNFTFANTASDSLEQKLNTANDSEKLHIYNKLSELYENTNAEKSVYYGKLSLKTQNKLGILTSKSTSFNLIGNGYRALGNNVEALNFYQKALSSAYRFNNKKEIARTINNMGVIYRLFGDYSKSLEMHLQALSVFREIKDNLGTAQSLNKCGVAYRNLNMNNKALECYNKAHTLSRTIGNTSEQAYSLLNIGNVYWYANLYNLALEYYQKALRIYKKENNRKEESSLINNIGNVFRDRGIIDEALSHYYKSVNISSEIHDQNQLAVTYKNIGKTFSMINIPDTALYYYKLSLAIASENNLLRFVQDDYLSISEVYEKVGNDEKTIKYLKLYIQIRDKIRSEERNQNIADLQYRFNIEQKEMEIKDLKLNKNQLILNIVFILFLIFAIIAALLYRLYSTKKHNATLLEKEIQERKIAEKLLSQSEEKFRMMADLLPEAIFETNTNGILSYVNNTWYNLFGYTKNDFEKGILAFDMIAPDDKMRIMQNRQKIVNENITIKTEYSAIKSDNTIFPVVTHISPLIISGKTIGTRGIIIDISEQKRHEQEQAEMIEKMKSLNSNLLKSQTELKNFLELTLKLNEKISGSEANMKAVFDGTKQSFLLINKDYKILSFNKSAKEHTLKLLNKEIKDFDSIIDYLPEIQKSTFKKNARKAFSGETIQMESVFDTGSSKIWYDISYSPAFDNEQNIIGASVTTIDITTRKIAEEYLRMSEQKYRNFVEQAADGIFISDSKGKIIELNSSILAITGFTKEELLEMNWIELFTADNNNSQNLSQIKSLSQGEKYLCELLICKKDQSVIPVEVNSKKILDNSLQIFVRDIGERKKSENALFESQRTLATVMSNMLGIVYRCKNDEDWTMEVISDGCYELTGYTPDDFTINKKITYNNIIHIDDRQIVFENVQKSINKKESFRLVYRIITINNVLKWVCEQGCGIFDEFGNLVALEGLIIDITEQKNIEKSYAISEQRLQFALEASNEGLWDFNVKTNKMDYLSPRFFTLLGYKPNEFEIDLKKLLRLIHTSDLKNFITKLRHFLQKKSDSFEIEFKMKSASGSYIWIYSRGKSVEYNEKKQITRIVGTHTDITKRKSFEENLIESEEKFRAAFENVNNGKVIIGINGQFLQWNSAFKEIFGYNDSELQKMSFLNITHPDDINMSVNVMETMQKSSKDFLNLQKRYIKKTGEILHASLDISMIRNTNKEPLYFITHIEDITEKKNASESQKNSEEKYRMLAEQTSDIIWIMDLKKKLTYLNPAVRKNLGYSVEEYLLLTPEQKFPPNAIKLTDTIIDNELIKIRNGITPGKNFSVVYELAHLHKNGSTIWGEVSFTFLTDENNNVYSIQGTTRNITERKRIEEAMRKSEERLKFALEASNDGLWDFNPATDEINYLSPRWFTLIGYEPYELPIDFTTWTSFVHDDDKENISNCLKNYLSGKSDTYSIEFRMRTKDNKYKWIHSRGKFVKTNADGVITRMVGTHSDISERKEAEDALKKSRLKYMELTEFLPQSIFEIDNTGKLLFANRQAFSSFKYTSKDFENGINVLNLVEPSDRNKAISNIQRVMNGENIIQTNYTMIRKDQTLFPAIVNSIPVVSNNEIIGLRGIIIDISEQKNIEIQLQIAKEKAEEADRLKSAFLANMSHEIRTPMNAILGFTELLKSTDLTEEKRNNFIDIICIRGKDLLNIINDIIDVSKIESKQLKINNIKCYLNAVMKEMFVFFENDIATKEKKKLKLKLKTSLPDHDSFVIIDDMRLKQIFTNLISNSIKFTTTGTIEFGYNIQTSGIIDFFVKDTGIGIPDDKLSLIFDRFRQADDTTSRQYGGTGLGLSISKSLVEIMGGNISVESIIGKGSTFSFQLPFLPYETINEPSSDKKYIVEKHNWSNKTILIAEDDNVNFLYLSTLLRKTKINIIHAANGKIAIELCTSNPSIDLVLMDIQMPEINGYDATAEIKKIKKDLPIIAQTAYAMDEDNQKCRDAGCDDFIVKPIKLDTILTILEKYF